MNNTKGNRIVFLDYLRIFAFISVLIGHKFNSYLVAISNDEMMHSTPRFIASLLIPLTQNGGAGVVVFFLVSGYIITHVLQTENSVEFLIKRIFRIYPLYIIAVLVWYIPLAIAGHTENTLTLLKQLLLIGDFFSTPYTLGGVEWTLRIEIIFYLFMAALRFLNLTTDHRPQTTILPYFLVVATLMCWVFAPIPNTDIFKGYLTIFAPFLFLGSMFYLFEGKRLGLTFLLVFIILVFSQYYHLMAIYQKGGLLQHYAIIGVLIFVSLWGGRAFLTVTPWVLILSDMTYAVYLFHMWLFDYAKKGLAYFNISVFNPDIQALIILILVSFFMVKYVEKPGVKLGRALLVILNNNKFQCKYDQQDKEIKR